MIKEIEKANHRGRTQRKNKNSFRADLVVEEKVIVELKTASAILPIHEAQIINYLNLSKLNLGLVPLQVT